MALYRLEPWGEERADLRAGIVASTVANAMMRKPDRTPFVPNDFMAYGKRPPADPEIKKKRMKAGLDSLFTLIGKKKG